VATNAYATAQIINTGAPAAVELADEGVEIGTIISSLDFVGAGVVASSVAGAVTVSIDLPEITDGGNF
jgi:hypothetical protein